MAYRPIPKGLLPGGIERLKCPGPRGYLDTITALAPIFLIIPLVRLPLSMHKFFVGSPINVHKLQIDPHTTMPSYPAD
jgi:hypothetical protein